MTKKPAKTKAKARTEYIHRMTTLDVEIRGKETDVLAFIGEHTKLLSRIAELENQAVAWLNKEASRDMEVAIMRRQIANLEKDRQDQDERIGWVRSLVDGSQKRPRDLGDSQPVRRL